MSADLLREAVALMRSRAESATAGPWTSGPHFQRASCASVFAGKRTDAHYLAMYATTANAEHMAGMHPSVALAVADWLSGMAARAEFKLAHGGDETAVWANEHHALKVARAYLGRNS